MSVSRRLFLDYLASRDHVFYRRVDLDWSEVVAECETCYRSHPEYSWDLVHDDRTEFWNEGETAFRDGFRRHREWGYVAENTQNWKTTCKQPQLHLSWEPALRAQLPFVDCVSVPTLLTPGNVMPWHPDGFWFYKSRYPAESQFVVRCITFLRDWDVGHFLQVRQSVITHWRAGDTFFWHPDHWHLAANAGIANRWTCNVTGLLSPEVDIELDITTTPV